MTTKYALITTLLIFFHTISMPTNQPSVDDTDEDVTIEALLNNMSDCYDKLIKITAIYFSGVLIDSEQLYREIIFEISKHLLLSCQIIVKHIPTLLKNKKISTYKKCCRIGYISCFLAGSIYWIRHMNTPYSKKNNQTFKEPDQYFHNASDNLSVRIRPKL